MPKTKKQTTSVVKAKSFFTKVELGKRYIQKGGKSYHVCIHEVENLVRARKKKCHKKKMGVKAKRYFIKVEPGEHTIERGGKCYFVSICEVQSLIEEKKSKKSQEALEDVAEKSSVPPFKKVYRLLLEREGEEDVSRWRYPVDPAAAINGILKCLTPGSMWSVNSINYWHARIGEEVDDYTGEKHIWIGSERQFGDDCRYWTSSYYKNIKEVMLGNKNAKGILVLKNGFSPYRFDNGMEDMTIPNDKIIIDEKLFYQMSKKLREQFLRNVYADEVYIKHVKLINE
jgi:hypothetical protein